MRARVRASGACVCACVCACVSPRASACMKDQKTSVDAKPKQAIYEQQLICDHSPGNTSQ